MRDSRTRFITPEEEAAPYPYRRVWRSLGLELGVLGGLAAGVFAAFAVVGITVPESVGTLVGIGLALAPLGLWFVFSWWPERRAPQPRGQLFIVIVLTALAANAVTVPLIEQVLQPQAWLSGSSAITRIVGYTISVGVAIEITKYLVLRYSIWPDRIRTRMDGVAYALAASVGMATVANLHSLTIPGITPQSLAVLVFDTTATNLAAGLLVGYGLSESALGRPTPFLGPLSVALAALIHGVAIPVRTGLGNASFTLSGGAANPVFGVAVSLLLAIVAAVLVSFLFGSAERREREAAAVEP